MYLGKPALIVIQQRQQMKRRIVKVLCRVSGKSHDPPSRDVPRRSNSQVRCSAVVIPIRSDSDRHTYQK